jgi:FKBP-type peptidyl-prolyl cis-trans isomerase 2
MLQSVGKWLQRVILYFLLFTRMKKNILVLVLLVSILTLPGCFKKNTPAPMDTTNTEKTADVVADANVVAAGDTIVVNYVGKFEDGKVFDTSLEAVAKESDLYNEMRTYEPLSFPVGAGQMIPGFDKGVVGMKKGEKKSITITPAEGYGEIREDLVQKLPLSGFQGAGIEPKVGETYNFQVAQGKVLKVEGQEVTIDFNHFLAGKTLVFDIEVVDIIKWGAAVPAAAPVEVAPADVAAETGSVATGN